MSSQANTSSLCKIKFKALLYLIEQNLNIKQNQQIQVKVIVVALDLLWHNLERLIFVLRR